MRNFWLPAILLTSLYACTSATQPHEDSAAQESQRTNDLNDMERRLDLLMPKLLVAQKAAGVGIGIVRDGQFVWQGYYGEQEPGVPASASTLWNTASVAKTLTAETLIALSAKGLIDLDEPIARVITHPDLAADPRFEQLTPRLLLSHRAGLLNWAYEYDDGRLAFDHDPGQRYSYSGAGMELAARYAEAKTGQSLQSLAFQHVLTPAGIVEMSPGVIPHWGQGRLAMPMDQAGKYREVAELNESLAAGNANGAADDLLTTVPAYAKLLVALIGSHWLTPAQTAERQQILTSLSDDPIFRCPKIEGLTCPSAHGYSLGWQVYQYGNHTVVKHSGSDAGENAIVYYSPDTRHGLVVLVNGANGWVIMARVMEVVGNEPLIAEYYRGLIQSVMGIPMPPLKRLR